MTPAEVVWHTFPAAVFVVAGVLRCAAARRRPRQGVLGVALLSIGVGLLLDVDPVYVWFSRVAHAANAADLAEHVCAVVGLAAFYEFYRPLRVPLSGRRVLQMRLAAAAAIVVIAVLFMAAGTTVTTPDFTRAYGAEWEVAAFWIVTLIYFVAVFTALAWRGMTLTRHSARRPVRVGVRLVRVGVAFGWAFVLGKLAQLVALQLAAPNAAAAAEGIAKTWIAPVWVLGIGAGLLWAPASERVEQLREMLSAFGAVRTLLPLWRALVATVPEVALAGPAQPSWPGVRHVRRRLHRMSVEIWDAILTIEPWAPGDYWLDERSSTADVLLIREAIARRERGDPPVSDRGWSRDGRASGEDLSILLALAREWNEPTAGPVAARGEVVA